MAIMLVICAGLLPAMVSESVPPAPGVIIGILFILYRGCVISLKPRGWDVHVIKSFFQPKQLNPGHTVRRCFVLPEVVTAPTLMERLRAKISKVGKR